MIRQTLCGELATRESDRALAADKDFLTLWKDADPDLSIVKKAKTITLTDPVVRVLAYFSTYPEELFRARSGTTSFRLAGPPFGIGFSETISQSAEPTIEAFTVLGIGELG
jgi:hypothetical protein